MNAFDIQAAISILREEYRFWKTPAVTIVAQCDGSPFKVLVSCLISLRTKDEVTAHASMRLFGRAATPGAMQFVPVDEVAESDIPGRILPEQGASDRRNLQAVGA